MVGTMPKYRLYLLNAGGHITLPATVIDVPEIIQPALVGGLCICGRRGNPNLLHGSGVQFWFYCKRSYLLVRGLPKRPQFATGAFCFLGRPANVVGAFVVHNHLRITVQIFAWGSVASANRIHSIAISRSIEHVF
jgi:hypothetical protein